MTTARPVESTGAAPDLITSARFRWHQRFELVPGVHTPGLNDIGWLFQQSSLPPDLSGLSALDIGTTNGGIAFELERRGARPVVAVDVAPPELFGFEELRRFLDSSVEFVQASVYELPEILDRAFDVVVFWGVLYHLRHPLLALDKVRAVATGKVLVETAVADHELGDAGARPVMRFYRRDELGGDPTNWFAPSVAGLTDWMGSSGFEVGRVVAWPTGAPERALVEARVVDGPPEFETISGERPLAVLPQLRSDGRPPGAAPIG